MRGQIFNIQKFCINDGPGIRTTVFFKGCPLRCEWCHNPESHSVEKQIMFYAEKCIGCGRCNDLCEENTDFVCPVDAKKVIGKEVSVDMIIEAVVKDKIFYDNSGGGITLSGGEPLLQYEFALALLKEAKRHGINTCIETCGFCDTEKLCEIVRYTDVFLYDWKCTDDTVHKQYTGVSNKLIERNLYAIDEMGIGIILRCPIIPEVNDCNPHFEGISRLANSLKNVKGIEIEPYHSLGSSKYKALHSEATCRQFKIPEQKEIDAWIEKIQKGTHIPVYKA